MKRTRAAVETTAEQCIRRGMPVSLLDRNAVREVTGTDRYLCAMLDRRGGDVQPLSYARGLARAGARRGRCDSRRDAGNLAAP